MRQGVQRVQKVQKVIKVQKGRKVQKVLEIAKCSKNAKITKSVKSEKVEEFIEISLKWTSNSQGFVKIRFLVKPFCRIIELIEFIFRKIKVLGKLKKLKFPLKVKLYDLHKDSHEIAISTKP